MARTCFPAFSLLALACLIGCGGASTKEPPIQSTLLSNTKKSAQVTTVAQVDKNKKEPKPKQAPPAAQGKEKAKEKEKKQLVPGVELSADEEQFVKLIHDTRDTAKLQRLNPHPTLFRLAKDHAGKFDKAPDSINFGDYDYETRRVLTNTNNTLDIAEEVRDMEDDIKETKFHDFGVGVARDPNTNKIYIVVIFARPAGK